MKRIILSFLDFFLAREFFFLPINTILLKLFLRFIGYNQYRNLASSIGEKIFRQSI